MKELQFLKLHSKAYKGYLVGICILNTLYSAMSVAFSLFVKNLIDSVGHDINEVILNGVMLLVLVILEILAVLGTNMLYVSVKAKVRTYFQRTIFNNLLTQNSLSLHSGDYISRMTSDVAYVTDGVVTLLPATIGVATKIVGAMFVIGYIDLWLFIFIAVLGVVFVGTHYFYKKFLSKYHRSYQEKEAASRSFMQEMIENQSVIHSFGKDSYIIGENEKRLKDLLKIELKRNHLRIFASTGAAIALMGAYACIIVYGAFKMNSASSIYDPLFTYGGLTALMTVFTQLEGPITQIADINHAYVTMKESTRRVMDILENSNSDILEARDFSEITINDFDFSYEDALIFKNANFKLNKGESITIKGPSGVGKSTLIKILLGKIETNQKILVDGKVASLNKLISYVPQGNWLLSGTIRENLSLFDPNIKESEMLEALDICCVKDFVLSLEDGLDTNILERAKDISEGQAQRIAIARGLLLKKEILLLDEVTSALDQETERKLLKNLSALGKTIIYISHKDATNEYSDRVLEIKDFKIN